MPPTDHSLRAGLRALDALAWPVRDHQILNRVWRRALIGVKGTRGRPDYLLTETTATGPGMVPLELKPHRRSRRLYESDAVQLGAYLLLARATFGPTAAPFGYIRYANAEFRVEPQ